MDGYSLKQVTSSLSFCFVVVVVVRPALSSFL